MHWVPIYTPPTESLETNNKLLNYEVQKYLESININSNCLLSQKSDLSYEKDFVLEKSQKLCTSNSNPKNPVDASEVVVNIMKSFCYWDHSDEVKVVKKEEKPLEKSLAEWDKKAIKKLSNWHSETKEYCKKALSEHLEKIQNDSNIAIKATTFVKIPRSKKSLYIPKDFRGSKYRGVSINGRSWQVFIVVDKKKRYAGCVKTQLEAALLYDKLAILFHGTEVWIKYFNTI